MHREHRRFSLLFILHTGVHFLARGVRRGCMWQKKWPPWLQTFRKCVKLSGLPAACGGWPGGAGSFSARRAGCRGPRFPGNGM